MKVSEDLINTGYISKRKHKDYDYYIYNYTPKAQYERVWNEDTLNCRGLIIDWRGNIIARPFKKFFNLEEYADNSHLGQLPSFKSFEVYEKMDGSLGILYRLPSGEERIATRGSFESEQAQIGTQILKEKYSDVVFPMGWTFLFEIIYPQNRIVVDYGDKRDLILLAAINNKTGEEMSYEELQSFCDDWNVPLVKRYGMVNFDLKSLGALEEKGREGFVIQFDHGLRVKMKFAEYVRLHKIITGVSTKTIWELLRNNQPVDQIIDKVPDEFYDWFTQQMRVYRQAYKTIEQFCEYYVSDLPDLTDAEKCGILPTLAKKIQQHKYRSVIFAMWRGKEYKDIIWKLVKPKYEQPFKTEV